jgi:hypothetical protein
MSKGRRPARRSSRSRQAGPRHRAPPRASHTGKPKRASQSSTRMRRPAVIGAGRSSPTAVGEEAQRPAGSNRASSWRRLPAAALRGLTNTFSPAARCRSLSFSKRRAASAPRHAPRAPPARSPAGAAAGCARCAGSASHPRRLAVAAGGRRTSNAVLVAQADRQPSNFGSQANSTGGSSGQPELAADPRVEGNRLGPLSARWSDSIGTA